MLSIMCPIPQAFSDPHIAYIFTQRCNVKAVTALPAGAGQNGNRSYDTEQREHELFEVLSTKLVSLLRICFKPFQQLCWAADCAAQRSIWLGTQHQTCVALSISGAGAGLAAASRRWQALCLLQKPNG